MARPTSELCEDAPEYRVAAVGRPPQTSDTPAQDQRRSAETPLRFIDLFCGIGGFRIAFEKAVCQCVSSSDWNPQAGISAKETDEMRRQHLTLVAPTGLHATCTAAQLSGLLSVTEFVEFVRGRQT